MASRMIHYAISKRVAETYNVKNYDRFVLGTILPDAYAEDRGTKDSHLKISICDSLKKTYDLDKFRMLFSNKLKTDDLYRGYYLHLIQDLYFRDFVYAKHKWNPTIPGNVEKLHRDYSLINSYVIKKYHLENRLIIPRDFHKENLLQLYPFGIEQLVIDFKTDFQKIEKGDYFFFTEAMADEFIEIAYEQSLKELEALNRGETYTDMYQMAWKNKTI